MGIMVSVGPNPQGWGQAYAWGAKVTSAGLPREGHRSCSKQRRGSASSGGWTVQRGGSGCWAPQSRRAADTQPWTAAIQAATAPKAEPARMFHFVYPTQLSSRSCGAVPATSSSSSISAACCVVLQQCPGLGWGRSGVLEIYTCSGRTWAGLCSSRGFGSSCRHS